MLTEECDRLLDGKMTDADHARILDNEWLLVFLEEMGEWEEQVDNFLNDPMERAFNPAFHKIKSSLTELTALTGAAYAAYISAREEMRREDLGLDCDDSRPAIFEFARRYREYTRYVEGLLTFCEPSPTA